VTSRCMNWIHKGNARLLGSGYSWPDHSVAVAVALAARRQLRGSIAGFIGPLLMVNSAL
jgi:hypothetical protein